MRYKINILLMLVIFALSGCQIIGSTNNTQMPVEGQIMPKSEVSGSIDGSLDSVAKDDDILVTENNLFLDNEPQSEPPAEESIELVDMIRAVNLPVGFASQAPFAVWDEFHEDTCEEAAIIMVVNYFNNQPISAHIMEQGLLDMVAWEEANGYKIDVTVEEVVSILDDYYDDSGVNAQLSTDVSTQFIKAQLDQGNLVIVPAAGRELGNPYFSGEGPIYHMLVIRGYDDGTQEFITNDPGTKRGEGYRYNYQVLLEAVHNWDHQSAIGGMTDDEMTRGSKILIVITKA